MGNEEFTPYSGIPTFWRLKETRDLSNVDIAVMGVPFDAGTSNRPGARFGPRSIRELSLHTGNFNYPYSFDVKTEANIIDFR